MLLRNSNGGTEKPRRADLREMRRHRDLLRAALVELDAREALEYRVKTLFDACRSMLPLSAMVLRDSDNQVVAASPSPIAWAVPETVLRQDDPLLLDVSDRDQPPRVAPLSPEGARPALTVADRQVGWLDVWGGRAPTSAEGRRTLSDVARVLAAMLARPRESTPGARDTMPGP